MAENERVFDYEHLAKKYNVKSDILNKLVEEANIEFPNDQMMIELHIVRAIRALKAHAFVKRKVYHPTN